MDDLYPTEVFPRRDDAGDRMLRINEVLDNRLTHGDTRRPAMEVPVPEEEDLEEPRAEEATIPEQEPAVETEFVTPEEPRFAQPPPPPPPSEAPAAEPEREGCATTVVEWLILLLLGAILGTALTLGILYAYNGTLDFSQVRGIREAKASISQIENQQTQLLSDVDALEREADRLSQTMVDLQEKTNTLESYTGTIRDELEVAKGDIASVEADLATTEKAVQTVQSDVKAVATEAAEFDSFLTGLRDVLIELQGTPVPTPTFTPTSTPTAAPTEAPAPTPTP